MGKKGPLWWRESDWRLRGSSAANQILLCHSGPILSNMRLKSVSYARENSSLDFETGFEATSEIVILMFASTKKNMYAKKKTKQENIPVGCVQPVCWPYHVVSHVSRGGWGTGAQTQGMGLPNPPVCRPSLVMWPVMHARKPLWTEWQTKHYLAPNFVCGR